MLRRVVAETIGTAFLLATVVGSGIMAERLAGGNVAIALLANSLATGAILSTLILTFGNLSGAHFNPAVTMAAASQREINWTEATGYIFGQLSGAIAGVAAANAMFGLPVFSISQHPRSGRGQVFSELVATFGLILVVRVGARLQPRLIALAVGGYITAAYWFTASTSFANPAVTLARSLSDTFAGLRPRDVPAFVLVQFAGAAVATILSRWLAPPRSAEIDDD